ncbi:hypothetical protein, partial [Microcoleus sp. PH2017_18_LLB_O_A]|uniref:hypothetical protein n=1 Tax=Microcoleus sp. PH2017_18_LLB_O_A TaxID=2798829 RepID=UPI0025E47D4B
FSIPLTEVTTTYVRFFGSYSSRITGVIFNCKPRTTGKYCCYSKLSGLWHGFTNCRSLSYHQASAIAQSRTPHRHL